MNRRRFAESYKFRVRLTGIIYLHCIIDVCIGGAGMKNLRMFRKLCGEQGLGTVILAPTIWSSLSDRRCTPKRGAARLPE